MFAWFVPVPSSAQPCSGGNAWLGRQCQFDASAGALRMLAAVLLIDARCHGEGDDAPFTSLPRFTEDIEAGLDWLHQQAEVDASRLAVMGHSVGAGAALLCATRRDDVRAVVSLSALRTHVRSCAICWHKCVFLTP